jgi:toxin YoeB
VKIVFERDAWADFLYLRSHEPKAIEKLIELIENAMRDPFCGIGKPEPLRENWAGWWSRRITQEHRLVYRVTGKGDDQRIEIAQCRFHY